MKTYLAHGLVIHSELELPELLPGDGRGDLSIHLVSLESGPADVDPQGFAIRARADEATYFKPEVGTFRVTAGRRIEVDPAPGADERVVRLSLLGPVMGLALHQRGRFVLHASTVDLGGRAVAFCGDHGQGKSTTAVELSRRGHRLIADDLTSIDLTGEIATVFPGHPQVKLWPDSAERVAETAPGTRLHPRFDKVGVEMGEGFTHDSTGLVCVYVLADGNGESHALDGPTALREILLNWYGSRFREGLLGPERAPMHLAQCLRLVERVEVRRLDRIRGLDRLPELAARIEAEVLGSGAGSPLGRS